ncbi:MAG: RluA family pseudouridine synthase [Thermogutta sp.]|nr:RluA family pseudouridine synthase [Thermogutta sp.]
MEILFEDRQVLVVNKPAGLATMGLPAGKATLLTTLKDFIRRRDAKSGNVYLGIVSRLDVPVSGAVLVAKTSKAAARLAEQFRLRSVEKTYWAVVEDGPRVREGRLRHWLRGDPRFRRVHVTHRGNPDAQEASLLVRRLAAQRGLALLEIELETGRKHQIRAQLSAEGMPIVGDRKYGSCRPFGQGIALHARRLAFIHPTEGRPVTVTAPLPGPWRAFGFATDSFHDGSPPR